MINIVINHSWADMEEGQSIHHACLGKCCALSMWGE